MPVSKKPRLSKVAVPAKKKASAPTLPDRHAIEGFLADLTTKRAESATNQAQAIMYDAWDETKPAKRIALAKKALAVSPLCADAWVLLAQEEAKSAEVALDLFRMGVEAGEKAIGPKGFKEYAGHFWGFLETRPYMRARAGLASVLWSLGHHEEAIAHYRAMLKLNPGDNQGLRYVLADHLLEIGDMPALKALLKQHEDDGSALMLYTRVLVAFRENSAKALTLAEEAWESNNHVPAALLNAGHAPIHDYYTLGGEDEAALYAEANGAAWRNTPGAIEWLIKATAGFVSKRPKRALQ